MPTSHKGVTYTVVSETSPTNTTSAYAAGDLIGSKLTFSSCARVAAGSGVILNAVLSDLDAEDIETDLVLFDSDPDATTFTDNSAFDPHDNNLLDIIGVVTFDDYSDFNDSSVAVENNLGIAFNLTTGTALYGALVTRGAPTYTTTGAIQTRIFVLQD